jgi:hypothetical protein
MAKRTTNRSTAQDSGAAAAPAQPRARRPRSTAPSEGVAAPEADMIGAAPGIERSEALEPPRDAERSAAVGRSANNSTNNATGIPSEAGDDAPLEAMSAHSTSMGSEPSEEDIRLRAYHRYLERGGGHGSDFEDWLEAERELKPR